MAKDTERYHEEMNKLFKSLEKKSMKKENAKVLKKKIDSVEDIFTRDRLNLLYSKIKIKN